MDDKIENSILNNFFFSQLGEVNINNLHFKREVNVLFQTREKVVSYSKLKVR